MNTECTRHDGGSIRKLRKGGEVNSPLPDLHHWPFALVLVILIRTLPLIRLPGPRTIFDKVVRTTAIEIAIGAASLLKLLIIWPWAKLLRLLRRHWRSVSSLLLGRAENKSARWGILLRRSGRCIPNKSIPRWLSTCGSSRSLSLLFGMVYRDAILLGQGHVNQFTKVLAFSRFRHSLSLVLKPRRKRSCFLASLSA
jgi:hypothetical protein